MSVFEDKRENTGNTFKPAKNVKKIRRSKCEDGARVVPHFCLSLGLTQQNAFRVLLLLFRALSRERHQWKRAVWLIRPGAAVTLMLTVTADESVLFRASLSVESPTFKC